MRRHHLADIRPSLKGRRSSFLTTLGSPLRRRADAQRGKVRQCPSVVPNKTPSVKRDKMQRSKIVGRKNSQRNGIFTHTHLQFTSVEFDRPSFCSVIYSGLTSR